ncbi:hypothetical protein [Roseovarius rhodophyticola]|uniref:Histidinol phosphate aminotransferase n=1 Tax=Roseovarius rhodophyticola TaxID=3080827 RepID=A0ABZ2TH14_9RHOB|nr:hypothetical protein [Roseovarius sp. W115]MDV2929282.1 hypothetical protein [Roseovarius sp. W115]
MRDREVSEAPNYTNAALVMGAVNLIWIFIVLWAVFGFHIVLAAGWLINWAITRLLLRRA